MAANHDEVGALPTPDSIMSSNMKLSKEVLDHVDQNIKHAKIFDGKLEDFLRYVFTYGNTTKVAIAGKNSILYQLSGWIEGSRLVTPYGLMFIVEGDNENETRIVDLDKCCGMTIDELSDKCDAEWHKKTWAVHNNKKPAIV